MGREGFVSLSVFLKKEGALSLGSQDTGRPWDSYKELRTQGRELAHTTDAHPERSLVLYRKNLGGSSGCSVVS